MTQIVHVRDIRAAGGLCKWVAMEANKPRPTHVAEDPVGKRLETYFLDKHKKALQYMSRYTSKNMNKLESRYAMRLEAMRAAGELACWTFEAVKLRLADKTFYTPDFIVMHLNGDIEFHETKGFWRDDARVKIKVAAELFPMFSFVAVQWSSKTKNWAFEFFSKPRR